MRLVVGALESGGTVNAGKGSMAPATMLVEFGFFDNVTAVIALEATCHLLPVSKLIKKWKRESTVPDHGRSILEKKRVFRCLAPCLLYFVQTQTADQYNDRHHLLLLTVAECISL